MLSTTTAVRLVFVFDDFLVPMANGETVPIRIDPDRSYSSRQTVCRGEQQVEERVSNGTVLREVLPVVIGTLMAEIKLRFIITSALQHR